MHAANSASLPPPLPRSRYSRGTRTTIISIALVLVLLLTGAVVRLRSRDANGKYRAVAAAEDDEQNETVVTGDTGGAPIELPNKRRRGTQRVEHL